MADSTLNILIKLRDLTRSGIAKLKRNFSDAADAAEDLEDVDLKGVEKDVKGLNRELKNTTDEAAQAAEEFNELRSAGFAIAAIGVALAAPFLAAAKAAGEFQTQIAEIETLVAPTATANEELRESVVNLSNEFGVDRSRVAAALYQTISTGATAGAEANRQLSVALTLARGGVADVEEATLGLATVLNAFGLASSQAEEVADSLFTTVKGGATTISQLSQFLFQAAPLASALSVNFKELNAAIQTITLSGTPTAQATTQIRAALQGLARDTPEVVEALGDFGSVSEAISKIGLQRTFDQIRKASKGSEAALIKLVGSIEGVQAVLQLTGKASQNFTDALKAQDEAAGAAARAAGLVEQSFGVKLETALTRISNAFTELGEAVIPVLEPMVEGLGRLAVSFQQLLSRSELAQDISKVTLGFLAFVISVTALFTAALVVRKGLTVLQLSLKGFGRGLRLVKLQLIRAAGALRVFKIAAASLLGPVGFIVTILLTLSSTALALASDLEDVTKAVDDSIEAFQALSEIDKIRAVDLAGAAVQKLKEELAEAVDLLEQLELRQAGKGNIGQEILTTQADVDAQRAVADELETRLETLTKKFVILQSKSEINLGNVDATNAGIQSYIDQLTEAEIRTVAFQGKLEDLTKEFEEGADATFSFDPSTGITALVEVEKIEGDITDQEEAQLQIIRDKRDEEQKTVQTLEEKLNLITKSKKIEDDIARGKEDATALELSTAEKVAALRAGVSITQAENRLLETSRRAVINIQNEEATAQTAELRRQLDVRLIDQEKFAAESKKILFASLEAERGFGKLQIDNARLLADAKIRVIEERLGREKLLLDAQSDSETASSSAATIALADAQIDAINLAFQATDLQITGKLTALGIRIKAQVAAIAADLAEGTIEGIQQAFSRLIATQEAQVSLANAQLAAGSITLSTAQSKIADAAQNTADVLTDTLIPAVEKLLLLAPQDPALLLFLDELNQSLQTTQTSLNEFEQGVRTILEAELANFFEDLLNGFDSLAEAADKFIFALRDAMLRLIAEQLAKRLLTSLFGAFSTGGFVKTPAQGGFIKAADGGILRLAGGSGPGGRVRGPGTSTSDSIPAMLSDGEYVMKAASVKQYGLQMMEAINRGIAEPVDVTRRLSITKPPMRRFQAGGTVGSPPSQTQLRAGASASGQQRAQQPTELVLNISDDSLNSMMRDVLEREFGRILATR